MSKLYTLILALMLAASATRAQDAPVHGVPRLNLGVGLSDWGVPVYVGLDFPVGHGFALGGELSFSNYRDRWNNYYYHHNIMGISGNINYHFNRILNIPERFDFYAGLNLGYYIWSSPIDYPGDHVSGLGLGAQIGGRYYFSNRVGINLEIGGGNAFSGGKLGLTFKL